MSDEIEKVNDQAMEQRELSHEMGNVIPGICHERYRSQGFA